MKYLKDRTRTEVIVVMSIKISLLKCDAMKSYR
jgi:hypothetical protein